MYRTIMLCLGKKALPSETKLLFDFDIAYILF